jgi:Dolichyl-phosphate-mannose-protein mannosyltransferase
MHLLIVAWLPGAIVFRLPWAERDTRAALDAEERWFWAVIISVSISLSITLALAVAGRYSFERLLIADLAIAGAAGAAGRFRLGFGGAARRPGVTMLLPVVLVLLGVWRFFPPSENIIGGRDPGTYVNEGVQIAQRGTIVYRDPVIASVPPFARDLFFPSHQRSDYFSVRFMGFRIDDPDSGAVVGQFPHIFPASIAIGYGLDGLTGARRAVGVWAILGVLAVYFAGARLFGRPAAFAAAALLALHVIQVWFARYPNAEVVMQALLFAALLAHARAHVDGDRFFAPIAGSLLGLLLFLRFDAVLGIAAVLAALALMVLAARVQPRASFFVSLGLVIAAAVAYLLGPMRGYADLPIVFLSNFSWWQYGLLAVSGAAGLAALVAGSRNPALGAWVRDWVPALLTFAIIAAAAYAFYLREPIERVLAERDAYALRTFTSFYLTVPGLVAALLGFALFARRMFWQAPELFTTVAFFSFFFFYKIRIVSDHFWMARRFLPVILPGALLFAAAAALGGTRGGWAPARLVRRTIGLAFVAMLATQYARAAAPVMAHVEYAGIIPKLESIAAQIGDRDLLVVESRNASDTHVLAVPLAYIYARNVIVLNTPRPDKGVFAGFLDWARTRYDRVLFMGGGGTDLLSAAWSARAIASERFAIPEYDAPADAYPRFVRQKEFDYSLYELTPPDPEARGAPFDLDVGVNDDLHVVRFHAKEKSEDRTFRWSRERSLVSITSIAPTSHELVLSLNDGGRPPAVPPADVTVALAGEVLGTLRVTTGFKPYALALPRPLVERIAAAGGAAELAITASVWKPASVLGTPDDRQLGVMVDRVTVK